LAKKGNDRKKKKKRNKIGEVLFSNISEAISYREEKEKDLGVNITGIWIWNLENVNWIIWIVNVRLKQSIVNPP
jgi:hypothetical protein